MPCHTPTKPKKPKPPAPKTIENFDIQTVLNELKQLAIIAAEDGRIDDEIADRIIQLGDQLRAN